MVSWTFFVSSDCWLVPLLPNIPQQEEDKYFSAPHQPAVHFQFHVRGILFPYDEINRWIPFDLIWYCQFSAWICGERIPRFDNDNWSKFRKYSGELQLCRFLIQGDSSMVDQNNSGPESRQENIFHFCFQACGPTIPKACVSFTMYNGVCLQLGYNTIVPPSLQGKYVYLS